MSLSWRSGRPYDVIRAERDADVSARLAELVAAGAIECAGYPGFYVTTAGDVYSTMGRRLIALRPGTKPGGYKFVGLSAADGVRRYEMVHRLVAKAFVPNPLNLPHVNHRNAVKADNSATNLEWCTPADNSRHAVAFGLIVGVGSGRLKLTAEQVEEVRKSSESYGALAKRYGVSKQTVCNIKGRRGSRSQAA